MSLIEKSEMLSSRLSSKSPRILSDVGQSQSQCDKPEFLRHKMHVVNRDKNDVQSPL